jgi:hypothetical protein
VVFTTERLLGDRVGPNNRERQFRYSPNNNNRNKMCVVVQGFSPLHDTTRHDTTRHDTTRHDTTKGLPPPSPRQEWKLWLCDKEAPLPVASVSVYSSSPPAGAMHRSPGLQPAMPLSDSFTKPLQKSNCYRQNPLFH